MAGKSMQFIFKWTSYTEEADWHDNKQRPGISPPSCNQSDVRRAEQWESAVASSANENPNLPGERWKMIFVQAQK